MILFFDTSTPNGILALGQQDRCITFSHWKAEHSHSQLLPPYIDTALQELPNGISELTHITVGIGPGSFTGLRVALATAKGLAIARNIPLVAIPSPTVFATLCQATTDYAACCLDAFRGEIYLGIYKMQSGIPVLQNDIASLTPKVAAMQIAALNGSITVTGTGYDRYRDQFPSSVIPGNTHYDKAAAVSILKFATQSIQNNKTHQPAELHPYYVRDAEAVEKQKR
ncbi:MAG: tRNA (adenosine(37)-N6)-threonylcarbamoyltransferase complex dimerization subunit type 1 TsaB [Deltaproteobacteria bacterium CG11_big_fil_rev_8_21_14_0_20_47_16]|nr:MAG: tRNA (adenosine(37)-N6)-threonylcarbamoyltransferase complex dimerization subunit type 1 TsaB [Deltaproteobacteria bacterium CG11_big_fil_rev_8_21_14_0_20_47_16]